MNTLALAEYDDIDPHLIEGSSFVVLPIFDYQLLLNETEFSDFEAEPQFLKNAYGRQTHVVLIDRDFDSLIARRVHPDYLFRIDIPKKGVRARGEYIGRREDKEGFRVLKGSTVGNVVESLDKSYKKTRKQLVKEGIVQPVDGTVVFCESYIFKSPSEAASIVSGCQTNGNDAWRDRYGRSLAERGLGETRE